MWFERVIYACELTMVGFQRVGPPPSSSTYRGQVHKYNKVLSVWGIKNKVLAASE